MSVMCVCACEQVLEISPPKNLAIWSSTHIPREKDRDRWRVEPKQGLSETGERK